MTIGNTFQPYVMAGFTGGMPVPRLTEKAITHIGQAGGARAGTEFLFLSVSATWLRQSFRERHVKMEAGQRSS
jgi:hypothetical protein